MHYVLKTQTCFAFPYRIILPLATEHTWKGTANVFIQIFKRMKPLMWLLRVSGERTTVFFKPWWWWDRTHYITN